jgi:hypothetical protein
MLMFCTQNGKTINMRGNQSQQEAHEVTTAAITDHLKVFHYKACGNDATRRWDAGK